MTQQYWERNPLSLTKAMRLPWLHSGDNHVIRDGIREEEEEEGEVLDAFVMLLERNRALRRRLTQEPT